MRYCLIIMILGAVLQNGGCRELTTAGPTVNNAETTAPGEVHEASSAAPDADKSRDANEIDSTVVAYYFHRTIRCPTCIAIEQNAAEVITNRFKEQLANQRLVWLPFNLDDEAGSQFEKEFGISGSTLVVAEIRDGNFVRFKKLDKVWELIGDVDAFHAYVRNEVKEYLNE